MSRAETRALVYALRRLARSTAFALADGILSIEELIAIGAGDLPGLIGAIVDLATPDEGRLERARVVVREGRALVRRRRRAATRLRRMRETRRVVEV